MTPVTHFHPSTAASSPAGGPTSKAAGAAAGSGLSKAAISSLVLSTVSAVLGPDINPDEPLISSGLDSLGAVELRNSLQAQLPAGLELPATLLFDFPSINAISGYIASQVCLTAAAVLNADASWGCAVWFAGAAGLGMQLQVRAGWVETILRDSDSVLTLTFPDAPAGARGAARSRGSFWRPIPQSCGRSWRSRSHHCSQRLCLQQPWRCHQQQYSCGCHHNDAIAGAHKELQAWRYSSQVG